MQWWIQDFSDKKLNLTSTIRTDIIWGGGEHNFGTNEPVTHLPSKRTEIKNVYFIFSRYKKIFGKISGMG